MTAQTHARRSPVQLTALTEAWFRERGWSVREALPGMRVQDAWTLPIHGSREEFPKLVRSAREADTAGWTLGDLARHDSRIGRHLVPVFSTAQEWAAAQHRVKGDEVVVHLGWVRAGSGYQAELAVLARDPSAASVGLARSRAFRRLVIAPHFAAELVRRWANADEEDQS